MELAFAGVHQLCFPMLDHVDQLPAPQRAALCTALGLAEGPPPDRFLVGLAVLNLLAFVAADRPLLCLVDVVAETGGNPLALLELPRGLTADELAGGFGLPGAVRPSAEMEEIFRSRIAVLPDPTRRLLLLAAAEPTGDSGLIWRAAGELGIGPEAAAPAIEAELSTFATRVRFRHPLVRGVGFHQVPPLFCAAVEKTPLGVLSDDELRQLLVLLDRAMPTD